MVAGVNPVYLKNGIEKAVDDIVTKLKNTSIPVKGRSDMAQVGMIAGNNEAAIASLPQTLPGLMGIVRCAGAGHWLQQERVEEVNTALLTFLNGLD